MIPFLIEGDSPMIKPSEEKERLSIDLPCEEHRQIKVHAARLGISIRVYVLECIRKHLAQEEEERQLTLMTTMTSPVLKEVWNNDKDAAYDQL